MLRLVRGAKVDSTRSLGIAVAAVAAALLGAAGLGAWGNLTGDSAAEVYDPGLQQAYLQRDTLLNAALPPLAAQIDGHPTVVLDCAGYLSAVRFAEVRASWAGNPGVSPYLGCLPLQMLAAGSRPTNFLAPADQLGRLLAQRLDPASLDGGLVGALLPASPAAEFAGIGRLSALPADRLGIGPRTVGVDLPAARWRFEVAASLDFDGSGNEALLLRVTRQALHAEMPDGVGYAIVQQGQDGRLRAVPAERALLPNGHLPWWVALEPVS